MRGVPLDRLCCPTCGDTFADQDGFTYLHRDEDPLAYGTGQVSIDGVALGKARQVKVQRTPPHVVCQRGHRWSVVLLERIEGESTPDYVSLGCYLGGGQLAPW